MLQEEISVFWEDIVSVENLEKKLPGPPGWGFVRRASYPSMENICKLKTLNEGMEPDGLMDADEKECKGIRVINYGRIILTL